MTSVVTGGTWPVVTFAVHEAPSHTHSFTYAASGATITATCSADGCTLPPSSEGGTDHVATLTIAAPALTTYGGAESAEATITDADGIRGDAKVMYQTKSGDAYGAATENAPTSAGRHKASITLGTDANSATAFVEYEIAMPYPVWVGGVQVTSANKDDVLGDADEGATVSYDADTATLTLDGANVTSGSHRNAAIFSEGIDLTINVVGDSTVVGPDVYTGDNSYGIDVRVDDSSFEFGNLTIEGSGALTATGGKAWTGEDYECFSDGISVERSLTINGELIARSSKADFGSHGVDCLDITVNENATLIAEGALDDYSFGILATNGRDGEITICENATVIAAGSGRAIYGPVKNAIAGTGWTDVAGTEGEAAIEASETGQWIGYLKVQFLPAHAHDLAYSAEGATITATCSDADGRCALPPSCEGGADHVATITIAAPTLATYGGTGDAAATLDGADAFNAATGMAIAKTDIKYYAATKDGDSYATGDEALAAAPTGAGDYVAELTLAGVKTGPETTGDVTASVGYTIAKAATTVTAAPTAGDITYGQTLADSALAGGKASVAGTFAWRDPKVAPAVADSQRTEYDVVFTPSDPNYATAACRVTLTVGRADISKAKVTLAKASYAYDGKAKEPKAKVTLGGRALKAGRDFSVSYKNNAKVGTATATIRGAGNYQGTAKATFSIVPTKVTGLTTAGHPAKGTLDVAWEAAAGAKTYQLSWRKAGGKWKSRTVKGTSAAIEGLKAGGLYEVRVRARAGSAAGAWSKVAGRWLMKASSLKAAAGKAKGTVRVSWAADAQATGGYVAYACAKKDGKVLARKAVAAGRTSATLTGLASGKAYYVKVRPLREVSGTTYVGVLRYCKATAKAK